MAMAMGMSMSMSNVLLEPPWTFIAPKPTRQPPSRFKNSFSYTLPRTFIALKPTKLPPSPSFSTRHLSHRLSSKHAAVGSISLLLKEHKGFVVNRNSSAFWALSFWDDVKQTDKKSTCICAAKNNNNVTEKKYDKQAAKRTSIKTQRRSGGKRSRKIYAVIIGVSFCVVLAIFPLVQPKQCRALLAMIQRLPFMSMLSYFFTMLKFAVSWTRTYFWGYRLFLENNRHRKSSKIQSVTFDDVAGVDGAKTELLEIVSCLGEDSKYIELGAKLPRGVLLSGPPGTGKTLLARAVAGEADVAFFTISASEFVERYVGVGAARVRAIFQAARKRSPSIIFIDEIDAVGGERGTSHNRERDQTLNQLLTEMDGFEKSEKVVVIAATNRPEMLDPALVRPGRFSRKVVVGEPDEDGRRDIFGLYIDALKMEDDRQVISDLVASRTPGLVGADLENIANEAAFLAARRDGEFVTKEDVLQAVERAIATRKICKNDNARKICKGDNASTEAKSPYLFGQKALESVPFQGRSKEFSIKMGRIPFPLQI